MPFALHQLNRFIAVIPDSDVITEHKYRLMLATIGLYKATAYGNLDTMGGAGNQFKRWIKVNSKLILFIVKRTIVSGFFIVF